MGSVVCSGSWSAVDDVQSRPGWQTLVSAAIRLPSCTGLGVWSVPIIAYAERPATSRTAVIFCLAGAVVMQLLLQCSALITLGIVFPRLIVFYSCSLEAVRCHAVPRGTLAPSSARKLDRLN
ncbi:hypothetical protein BKA66DRAFT_101035 [Pyrenochaeta sp. MPI-SDFR-AT-0127]|nr:hypothetical protein BKA66DRAFT_101035 [Pyrenochaeta sp. MPI-SDFR-AT-0127]